MKAACELLFYTDGFDYMEGLSNLDFTHEKEWEIRNWIQGIEVEDAENFYDEESIYNERKMAAAICVLRDFAIHPLHDHPTNYICRQFLAACEMKTEIDFADFEAFDTESQAAAYMVFQGILFHPERTSALLSHLVTSRK